MMDDSSELTYLTERIPCAEQRGACSHDHTQTVQLRLMWVIIGLVLCFSLPINLPLPPKLSTLVRREIQA